MRAWFGLPVFLAGLVSVPGCYIDDFGVFDRYTKDFHYSYPLKPAGRLSVETFNGTVEVSGWDQETVDISGTKTGPRQDALDTLKIEITNSPDAVSIRAVRPTEFRRGWGARFSIKVPRRAVLEVIQTSNGQIRVVDGSGPARFRTSNGAIRVQALEGGLDAQTSNGMVELTDVNGEAMVRTSNGRIHVDNLKGPLQARTSNGSVTATLAAGAANGSVRLDTSNGGVDLRLPPKFSNEVRVSSSNGPITLHLPSEVNARVMARTSNASVTSDFQVRTEGEFRKSRLEGEIGTGGPLLDLNTSNASIRLLRM
ncbi:MAG TPA: DUF4097 family beta strand repeat-containing protein [Bryobacteraceae bacterium]|jgi:hypothetical protein